MRRVVAAVAVMAVLSGCYTTKVSSPVNKGASHEKLSWYFVNGLTGAELTTTECGDKAIAHVEHLAPWWNYFVMGLTGSLVGVRSTTYTCAE